LARRATGYIQVFNATAILGYIEPKLNLHGEYGYLQSTTNGALEVTFPYYLASTTTEITITALNPNNTNYVEFGAIEGYDSTPSFTSSSSDYAVLGGTVSTAAGADPAVGGNTFTAATNITEDIESAVVRPRFQYPSTMRLTRSCSSSGRSTLWR
jgi:hypothetical protein